MREDVQRIEMDVSRVAIDCKTGITYIGRTLAQNVKYETHTGKNRHDDSPVTIDNYTVVNTSKLAGSKPGYKVEALHVLEDAREHGNLLEGRLTINPEERVAVNVLDEVRELVP